MLRFMGQKGLVARYPMHWHVMGAVDGQYFAGNSVWGSFNRCVTVHGSDNARVENNVCYDHLGHGYFLEDGAETGNLVAGNLGLGTKSTGEGVLPTDDRAATFWITNPDNTIRGNAAAGSTGFGFWYALPAAPTGLSTGQPELPRNTPLREFSNNVAHTNRRGGLHVDDGPRAGRHDRDHFLRAAHRSRRREHGRGRRLHPVHGLQAPRPGGLAQGTRPPLEQQRAGGQCHRRHLRLERDVRRGRALRGRVGQRCRRGVQRRSAPGIRVLRRTGGRRPGHLRQLHLDGVHSVERPRVQPQQRIRGEHGQLRGRCRLHQREPVLPGGPARRQGRRQGRRVPGPRWRRDRRGGRVRRG